MLLITHVTRITVRTWFALLEYRSEQISGTLLLNKILSKTNVVNIQDPNSSESIHRSEVNSIFAWVTWRAYFSWPKFQNYSYDIQRSNIENRNRSHVSLSTTCDLIIISQLCYSVSRSRRVPHIIECHYGKYDKVAGLGLDYKYSVWRNMLQMCRFLLHMYNTYTYWRTEHCTSGTRDERCESENSMTSLPTVRRCATKKFTLYDVQKALLLRTKEITNQRCVRRRKN